MTGASLKEAGKGRWRLAGELDFSSVPDVWPSLDRALRDRAAVNLSLDGVERANSAGLVMLLEALDVARERGCQLRLDAVPDELLDLARMSNCEALLAGNQPRR
ncbi:MAG: STAS domain-containing protein [Gammaproteobacteria bacterium]|nr:STAS domain-containing protein [Gammaproteobacteria bacterium]